MTNVQVMDWICVKLLLTMHENVQSSKESNESSLINLFKVFKFGLRILS